MATNDTLADRQRLLIHRLKDIPHQAMSLRRNKYRVIRRITKELKWDIVKDKDASMVWLDKWEMADLTNLRHFKVGHFPGMWNLGSKCNLGRTLNRMKQEFPYDYDYFPLSFCLPADKDKLIEYDNVYRQQARAAERKNRNNQVLQGKCVNNACDHPHANPGGLPLLAPPSVGCWPAPGSQPQPQPTYGDRMVYIVKPDGGSRGQGIYLALGLEGIEELQHQLQQEEEEKERAANNNPSSLLNRRRPQSASTTNTSDNSDSEDEDNSEKFVMVQAYLPRPLLMDGRKFDLRIYVLVTSVYPTLRVFIYRQGLVRFATEQYAAPNESNVAKRRMFLTNYAVNKPGERPRSPKTGIDDVPDHVRATIPTRYDANPAGGADDNGDDTESDDDTVPSNTAPTRRPAIPPRSESIDIVRARMGCKWTISTLMDCMEAQGVNTDALWERIKDVILKTILAVRPHMAQKYKAARPNLKKEPTPPNLEPKIKKRIIRPVYTRPSPIVATPSTENNDGGPYTDNNVPSEEDTHSPVTPVLPPELPTTASATTLTPLVSNGKVDPLYYPPMVGGMLNVGIAMNPLVHNGVSFGLAGTSLSMRGLNIPSASTPSNSLTFGRTNNNSIANNISNYGLTNNNYTMNSNNDGLNGFGIVGTSMSILATKPPLTKANSSSTHNTNTSKKGLPTTTNRVAAHVHGTAKASGSGSNISNPSNDFGLNGLALSGSSKPILTPTITAQERAMSASKAVRRASGSEMGDTVSVASSVTLARSDSGNETSSTVVNSTNGSTTLTTNKDNGSVSAPSSVTSTPNRTPSNLTNDNGTTATTAASATTSSSLPSAKPPVTKVSTQTSSNTNKDDLSTLEEEDGEQGFRAYELMGLDVILDMSHCICAQSNEHSRLTNDPKKWKKVTNQGSVRCQPRPVLLEINQSCSLHSDSDLDKIVKGDAVKDAFILASPDDKWLLERFAEAIKLGGGITAIANSAETGVTSSNKADIIAVAAVSENTTTTDNKTTTVPPTENTSTATNSVHLLESVSTNILPENDCTAPSKPASPIVHNDEDDNNGTTKSIASSLTSSPSLVPTPSPSDEVIQAAKAVIAAVEAFENEEQLDNCRTSVSSNRTSPTVNDENAEQNLVPFGSSSSSTHVSTASRPPSIETKSLPSADVLVPITLNDSPSPVTPSSNNNTLSVSNVSSVPIPADDLLAAVEAAEAILNDPNRHPRKTKVTLTNTVVDQRYCVNDIDPIVYQAVALARAAVTESASLIHAYRRGYPFTAVAKSGTPTTNTGNPTSGPNVTDENRPPLSSTIPNVPRSSNVSFIPPLTPTSPIVPSITDTVPWIPAPTTPLFTALTDTWKEEMWFGVKWNEKELNNSSSIHDAAAKSKSSFGGVVSTVLALKRAATIMSKAEIAEKEREKEKEAKEKAGVPAGNFQTLGSIPQLSPRAQLVLELRRLYEALHMGGFERVCPPPNPYLRERYRRIAEYVPPSMRETFAFAKRRLEALAMRAGIEAKKNSGFRI